MMTVSGKIKHLRKVVASGLFRHTTVSAVVHLWSHDMGMTTVGLFPRQRKSLAADACCFSTRQLNVDIEFSAASLVLSVIIYTLHSSPSAAERLQLLGTDSTFIGVGDSVMCGHVFGVDEARQGKSPSWWWISQQSRVGAAGANPCLPWWVILAPLTWKGWVREAAGCASKAKLPLKNCAGKRACSRVLKLPTWRKISEANQLEWFLFFEVMTGDHNHELGPFF